MKHQMTRSQSASKTWKKGTTKGNKRASHEGICLRGRSSQINGERGTAQNVAGRPNAVGERRSQRACISRASPARAGERGKHSTHRERTAGAAAGPAQYYPPNETGPQATAYPIQPQGTATFQTSDAESSPSGEVSCRQQ